MPENNKIATDAGPDLMRDYGNMFGQLPACCCLLKDGQLIHEWVNAPYQKLFTTENMLGHTIAKYFPALQGEMFTAVQNAYKAGRSLALSNVLLVAGNEKAAESRYYNLLFQPTPASFNAGQGMMVMALQGTGPDLLAATENENRFRIMVESSPVAMLVAKGENMIIETINAAMLALIDRTESVLGQPLLDAVPELLNDATIGLLRNIFTTGKDWDGTERSILTKKNGINVIGYFNVSYKALFENGKVTGILQTAVDVTGQVNARKKLKQSEENFRLLADNISQLAWMTDEMGYIFWYNERWYEYTNTKYEDMKGWGWQTVQHPDHVERVKLKFEQSVQLGDVWEDTFPLKGADGQYRWFLSRAVPLKDNDGRIVRWFGTNTDITDQRRLVQQKEDFISIASHELKTPLTSIKGYIQLLQLHLPPGADDFNTQTIFKADRQVNKMISLIKGFLDMSRFETGMLHFNTEAFDMCRLINDTIEESAFIRTTHKIVFADHAPVYITADKEKIGQVIANFLSNAAKYAAMGTRIEISCTNGNGAVQVNVRDEGPGIDQDHLNKIFDRFYRVNSGHSTTISGFGIGLFICSEIISLHHGKIWVESAPGSGSTFHFSLPVES